MAKIKEEIIILKVSKLVRDDVPDTGSMVAADAIAALVEAVADMVGPGHVVEVIEE